MRKFVVTTLISLISIFSNTYARGNSIGVQECIEKILVAVPALKNSASYPSDCASIGYNQNTKQLVFAGYYWLPGPYKGIILAYLRPLEDSLGQFSEVEKCSVEKDSKNNVEVNIDWYNYTKGYPSLTVKYSVAFFEPEPSYGGLFMKLNETIFSTKPPIQNTSYSQRCYY